MFYNIGYHHEHPLKFERFPLYVKLKQQAQTLSTFIWDRFKHASDHMPISVNVAL